MVRSATGHQDDSKDDEPDDGDDLQTGEPKLQFTESAGAKEVDDEDKDEEDGHVGRRVGSGVCAVSAWRPLPMAGSDVPQYPITMADATTSTGMVMAQLYPSISIDANENSSGLTSTSS